MAPTSPIDGGLSVCTLTNECAILCFALLCFESCAFLLNGSIYYFVLVKFGSSRFLFEENTQNALSKRRLESEKEKSLPLLSSESNLLHSLPPDSRSLYLNNTTNKIIKEEFFCRGLELLRPILLSVA